MLRINIDETWRTVVIVVVAAVVLVAGWELLLRGKGYQPTLINLHDEARRRTWQRIEADAVVIAGASQIMADIDLDELSSALGRPVHSLGRFATPADAALRALAARDDFNGVVIAGITEQYFHQGPLAAIGSKIEQPLYPDRGPSPSAWAHTFLSWELTNAFRFRTRPFWLSSLVKGVFRPSFWPTKNVMTHRLEWLIQRDEGDRSAAEDRKSVLENFDRLPPPLTAEELELVVKRHAGYVSAIKGRGGHVIYVRLPTSKALVELSATPKSSYWDVFCAHVDAKCLHSDDHESLDEFAPPDGIHLEVSQRKEFTRTIAPLFAQLIQ